MSTTLSTRPAQAPSTSALNLLTGRLLTITNSNFMAAAYRADLSYGGVVTVGADANKNVRTLRAGYPNLVIAAEPRSLEHVATEEAPLILPVDDGMVDIDIDEVLDQQMNQGASFSIIPAGFVEAGDTATLRAIKDAANAVRREDAALLLGLDPKFLEEDLPTLITIINEISHPVLVVFGSASNPLSSKRKRAGYRRLFEGAERAFPWRTDLAGFDAIVHGAPGAAIGLLPSQRRVNLPGKSGYSPNKADGTPNMLVVELLRYIKSSQLRRMYVSVKPPVCDCVVCDGKAIDRLSSSSGDVLDGHLHDMLMAQRLHRQIMNADDREKYWQGVLDDATTHAAALGGQIGQTVAVPDYVKEWHYAPLKAAASPAAV